MRAMTTKVKNILTDAVKLTMLIVSILGLIVIMTGLESILEAFGIPGILAVIVLMTALIFILNWIHKSKPGSFKTDRKNCH